MSCKEAAQFCPRNSFWHIGHFQTFFSFYSICQKGEIFLKKALFKTKKNRRKKLVRSRAKFDSRDQTPDQDPMSYERPDHVKCYLFQILHAILPINFAVYT